MAMLLSLRANLIAIGLLGLVVSAAAVEPERSVSRIAQESGVNKVLDEIAELALLRHVSISRFQRRGVVSVGKFSERPVDIECSGSFGHFRTFLSGVEGLHHVVRIHDMTIQRGTNHGPKGRPGIVVHMNVSIPFRSKDHEKDRGRAHGHTKREAAEALVDRVPRSALLKELVERLPASITLLELIVDTDENDTGAKRAVHMKMTGLTRKDDVISEYINTLGHAPLIDAVQLTDVRDLLIGKVTMRRFELTMSQDPGVPASKRSGGRGKARRE